MQKVNKETRHFLSKSSLRLIEIYEDYEEEMCSEFQEEVKQTLRNGQSLACQLPPKARGL